MKRFIPQPLVMVWCWLKYDHARERFSAWQDGIQVVVYTCRCGRSQTSHVLPANRKIRRGVGRRKQ